MNGDRSAKGLLKKLKIGKSKLKSVKNQSVSSEFQDTN